MIGRILSCMHATLLLLLVLCSAAHAQNMASQDLYLDAMKSIAEGRQTDASDTLIRMVEREPQHAGAWLDLAIIQCELSHAAEAERLFQAIESRFSPPPAILEVIAKLRAEGCAGWKPRQQTTIMVGRGIDSNANQGASNPNFTIGTGGSRIDLQLLPEYLPQRDQYTMLSAEYMRDLTSNGGIGFVQLRAIQNDALSRYNTSSIAAGMEHPWRVGAWDVHGTGMLAFLGLGGQLYQKQGQLQARITPPLSLPNDLQFSVVTGVTHVDYPTQPSFNADTWEVRGLLAYRSSKVQAQASVGYLSDRAAGGRPGGDRNGWFANAQGRTRLGSNLLGELSWTRQTWTGQSIYSPGLIDQIRHQETQTIRGTLIIPIKADQTINVELREVRNNENISIFQYNSRQLQVSWQWQKF